MGCPRHLTSLVFSTIDCQEVILTFIDTLKKALKTVALRPFCLVLVEQDINVAIMAWWSKRNNDFSQFGPSMFQFTNIYSSVSVLFKWEFFIQMRATNLPPSSLYCPSFLVEGKRHKRQLSFEWKSLIWIGHYSTWWVYAMSPLMSRFFDSSISRFFLPAFFTSWNRVSYWTSGW